MDWNQLFVDNFSGILVLGSVLLTQIGSVFIYKARRHFENQKETREYRAESIARWRAEIDKLTYWIDQDFQDSSTYAEIKSFLSEEIRQRIERGRGALSVTPRAGVLSEGESLKQMVLDEITRVERDVWKLT